MLVQVRIFWAPKDMMAYGNMHLNMLTKAGIVPGTIVESHRDADKEEDKLLSKYTSVRYVLGSSDPIRCVLLHRSRREHCGKVHQEEPVVCISFRRHIFCPSILITCILYPHLT
jgi:hypothetical protein